MAETYNATPGEVSPPMTAQARYESLVSERSAQLERAREAAKLSIPGLMPPDGNTSTSKLYTPWQSVVARGVNNLTAKLMLAMWPAGSSFFRLTMDDYVVAELAQKTQQTGEDAKAVFEEALEKVEKAVMTRFEQSGARLPLSEAKKQLIVSGNALLQLLPKGKLVAHKLNNYVVKRDPSGNVVEIVVKQCLSKMTLPERARAIVAEQDKTEANDQAGSKTIDVYTRVSRKTVGSRDKWYVCQEVYGIKIPKSEGTYPIDKTPWLPLRFTAIDGEDYGRGFVEEYIGDCRSLESLTKSMVQFAAVASKILFLVNEGGVTMKKKIARSASGDVIDGDAKEISVLALEKFADFQVSKSVADGIEKRLEQAFLLTSSVQRNAERVTAEEIRMLVGELEQTQAGLYTILGQELQRPLAALYMAQMQREGALPALPEKAVSPQIVTGLDALGRSSELNKLNTLFQGVETIFGPEAAAQYGNVGDYIRRAGTALGINTKGLVRTDDEVQAANQQKMAQQSLEKLGPPAIQAAAKSSQQQQPIQTQ